MVRHLCNHPACINPRHWDVGTHAANVADRVAAGRCARGEKNGRAKLTIMDVRAIREALAADVAIPALADYYKVDPRAVRFIRDGKTWQHVQ